MATSIASTKKRLSLKKNSNNKQMSSSKKENKEERVSHSLPYTGLVNLGNTCYINSIIQTLRYTPGIVSNIEKATYAIDSIGQKLKELLMSMDKQKQVSTAINPRQLVHKLQANHFEVGLQHDSQECLGVLLNGMSTMNRKRKPSQGNNEQEPSTKKKPLGSSIIDFFKTSNSTKSTKSNHTRASEVSQEENGITITISINNIVSNTFEGRLLTETKCMTCETSKVSKEVFTYMSVPVTEREDATQCGAYSLFWSLSRFASTQYLTSHNKYHCQICQRLTEGRHSIVIDHLPPTIIIHYKRFSTNYTTSTVTKAMGNIATPLSLSFSQWCSLTCPNKSSLYHLYGIILHSSSTCNSGHYMTLIKRSFCDESVLLSNEWLLFDDDSVSIVSANYVNYLLSPLSSVNHGITPYIVFYTREF